ncbi:MAG: hypothetical protein HKO72_12180, partial [Flavobacteriaceae bacterium]|nr:hypothetical protein [Bacteroidia bacterium]NNL62083.1 hypothetical protein [Flavobacteriaceae bacterium]
MSDYLIFQNNQLIWPVTLIAVLLLAVFIWKEWSSDRKNKIFRSLFAFFAILSLALMALKPVKKISTAAIKAIILTEGYDENHLDSIKNINDAVNIYNYKKGHSIFTKSNKPSSAIILGHGLKSFDFWQLSNIKTEYLGGTEPTGISDLKYEQNSFVDNDILIQGLYYNATEGNKLILEGQGEIAIDSVKLDSGKQSFKLSHRLKTPGKYVLGLLEKDSLDRVISRNPLPINVIATNALNILIVNSFPSFESKYLKNFLISLGHQITVRSQLSKGKYKYEYFNTA